MFYVKSYGEHQMGYCEIDLINSLICVTVDEYLAIIW